MADLFAQSATEELFIDIFTELFGADKSDYLCLQQPFFDIYGNQRYIDFALEEGARKIAIEVDGESVHNPTMVSRDKYYDDLLKQNSMIYEGWQVYRWAYAQIKNQPDTVKDELLTFLGEHPLFRVLENYLPKQKGEAFSLHEHQREALGRLKQLREQGKTIALLHHATGTGKTVTAVNDAKALGGKTLFLAHTIELVKQARKQFLNIWQGEAVGLYVDGVKENKAHIVCGSVQSVVLDLAKFKPDDFSYIVIDECHHSTADTYRRILGYFRPQFTLGLTATPERTDGEDLLELFRNVAHKLDLETAVKTNQLVPVRCIRIKTNINLNSIRINGIRYNARDLENKVFVPDRNNLIVDTFIEYVKDKATVIFCVSVRHANEIAKLLRDGGVSAYAVSGGMDKNKRNEVLKKYEDGDITVLCACDLLNEGWDSPKTEVLFMSRPTMSKTLYTQQLGRGMRLYKDKSHLMVFDFVDNANIFRIPYSMHRLLKLKDYKPGAYVVAPDDKKRVDDALYMSGEKPEEIIDYPIHTMDLEAVNLFEWQEEVKGMLSINQFVKRVSVQKETIDKYMRDGKIKPDFEVPYSNTKSLKYFKEETIKTVANEFGWKLITPSIKKQLFMEMIETMDMSYSYKPVFILSVLKCIDNKGRADIEDVTKEFIAFYEARKAKNLVVENKKSKLAKGGYCEKEITALILRNPFKRFEDMDMMRHTKTIGMIEICSSIYKKLNKEDFDTIMAICDRKIESYYEREKLSKKGK